MTKVQTQYDVVVIGAGPAGSSAAIAFARRDANVLLVEAKPEAASRFAGEWVHPTGVKILRDLGLLPQDSGLSVFSGRGFVVFPQAQGDEICLDYPHGGLALACEH